jgi:hypothetical protein
MTGHFLLNFPIYLATMNTFGLGEKWKPLLTLWILLFAALGAILAMVLPRRPVSRKVTEQP